MKWIPNSFLCLNCQPHGALKYRSADGTGSGAAGAEHSAGLNMAASSAYCLLKGKHSMKLTKRNERQQHVSVEEALQILQSALSYCQSAGLEVAAANSPRGLMFMIANVQYLNDHDDQGLVFRSVPAVTLNHGPNAGEESA